MICAESWCSVLASWLPALTTPSRAPSLVGALASELQALQKAESWLEMPEAEGSSKAAWACWSSSVSLEAAPSVAFCVRNWASR